MSNVTIMASEETGLEVDVVLGANVRKTHEVPGGEGVELTVGGGQTLTVRAASNVAPTADVPQGVDVSENEVVLNEDGDVMFDPNRVVSDEEAAATAEASAEDLGADLFADKA